ncbi:hypothetical protein C8Q80DRAFT_1270540 [Daedaleopsis nitida]|nr:hypothetical protein C8Q80DRAFT_1270540 [Daedaleopsis nitida]
MGSHCAEALLIRYRLPDGEKQWHEVHKTNNENFRLKHPTLYKIEGTNVKKRLLVAAESFPRCKPGHSAMQLGWYDWYDQELRQQPKKQVTELETPRPPTLRLDESRHDATERADSPLTPLNSSFGSPAKVDDDVISLDDSEDELEVSASALNARKYNRAYVEINPSSSSRSVSAKDQSATPDPSDAPRTRRSNILGGGAVRSLDSRNTPGALDDHLAESYGSQLASALQNANNAEPLFSEDSRQMKGGSRRTVIDPDGDRPSRPSISSIVHASDTVPLSQKPAATEDTDTPMAAPPLPRFPRAAKKSLQLLSQNEDDDFPTPSSVSSSTRGASKKRKGFGPPGLRELPQSISVPKRTEEPTRKKARLTKPPNDELDNDEVLEIPSHGPDRVHDTLSTRSPPRVRRRPAIRVVASEEPPEPGPSLSAPTQVSSSARSTFASKTSSEVPMDTYPDVVAPPTPANAIRSSLTSTAPRRAVPMPNTAVSAAPKAAVSTTSKASIPAPPKAAVLPVATPPANVAIPTPPPRVLPPPALPIPGTGMIQTTFVPEADLHRAQPESFQMRPSVADAARAFISALTAEMPLQSAARQALEKTSEELKQTKQELADLRGHVQVLREENEELASLREQMQAMKEQNEELVIIREQIAVLTKKNEEQNERIGKNDELEQKVKMIAIGYEKMEEDLKKERVERGIVAKVVRQLEEQVSRCDVAHSPDAVKLIVDHYCKESAERSIQESMQKTPKEDLERYCKESAERYCKESAERHCEKLGERYTKKWMAELMPGLTHAVRELSHMAVETYLKETLIYQEMTTRVTGPAAAANLLNARIPQLYPGSSPSTPSGGFGGQPRPTEEKHTADSGDARRHSRQYGSQSSSSKHQQWSSQHRLSGSQSVLEVGRPAEDLASLSAAGGSRDEARSSKDGKDSYSRTRSRHHRSPSSYSDRHRRDRSYDRDDRRRRGRSRSRSHNGSDTRRRRSRSRSPERRHRRDRESRDHRGSDESDELADQALSYPDHEATPEESHARRTSRSNMQESSSADQGASHMPWGVFPEDEPAPDYRW